MPRIPISWIFKRNFYNQGAALLKLNQSLSTASTKVDTIETSKPDPVQQSLKHPDFFGVAKLFNVEDLFRANVHLGHREGTLCNYMKPYIFGSRLGYLILDLDQTCSLLRDALNFTAHIAFRGGIILFIARAPQHQLVIEQTAQQCGEYSHTKDWDTRTMIPLKQAVPGVRVPDLFLFLNTKDNVLSEHPGVRDAGRLLIPSVGIVDTNCDPRLISYPVPGNDDTPSAIKFYCNLFKEAILIGKQKRKELLTYSPT